MEKRDFRKLSSDAQLEIKKAALKMVKAGKSQLYVADFFGISRRSLYTWLKQLEEKGPQGLKYRTRGRRHGEQRVLTVDQEKLIQRLIVDKCPEQLKLPFALWTRKAVQELIECIIRFYSALIPEIIRQVIPAVFGTHSGQFPAGF